MDKNRVLVSSEIHKVLGIILGGGMGKRLHPLTTHRSKPAVPFGGNYRIVDIPISNCVLSDINRIFVLTQFNSASLNRHINQTYKLDIFHHGFVEVLASEETRENIGQGFSHGTAEAVRKSIHHFFPMRDIKYVLILAGDQLYKMDFKNILRQHIEQEADVTIGVISVNKNEVSRYGIVKMDENKRAHNFIEKPENETVLQDYGIPPQLKCDECKDYFASMNMYLFNIETLEDSLSYYSEMTDFGSEIIPAIVKDVKVDGYIHSGYWEDIGTIKTFHTANIALTRRKPIFNLFDDEFMFFTKPRFLPPSKIAQATITDSIISDGAIIEGATITNSVIGVRSIIKPGAVIENSVIMGNDFYETDEEQEENNRLNIPAIGIGKNCEIRNAIIDKNCRIGANSHIVNISNIQNEKSVKYLIQDGIIVLGKGTIVREGSAI